DRKIADAGDIAAERFGCPQPDAVHLPVAEDIGDLDTRNVDGRRAPYVSRLQSVLRRCVEVHAHLDLRDVDLLLDVQIDQSRDVFQAFVDVLRFGAHHREARTEDPHDDRFARARQYFLDPFAQVRLHVPIESGIAADRLLDPRARRVEIDLLVDADP